MAICKSIHTAVLGLENELVSQGALHRAFMDAAEGQDVPWVTVLGDMLSRIDAHMNEVSRLTREGLRQEESRGS